jgi:hypothetical protein
MLFSVKRKLKLQAAPGPQPFLDSCEQLQLCHMEQASTQDGRGREKKSGAEAGSDKTG